MSNEIEYTMRVIKSAAEDIQHEMNQAEISAMVDRHYQTCTHLREAVIAIEMVIAFVDKSKVKKSVAIASALTQVLEQVEKINKLVENGYWVDMCARLSRKRKIDSVNDEPDVYLPSKKYIGLFK